MSMTPQEAKLELQRRRSDRPMIEPFVEYRGHSRPTLRAWTTPKTMSVEWHWNPGLQFASALDSDAMNAELLAIWRRCKPQCRHRASFSRGQLGGFLGYVPHEAGYEAVTVIRKYFTKAIETMSLRERA